MILEYNGTDITGSVTVKSVNHELHAAGRPDTLRIDFDNEESRWDEWSPTTGDQIKATEGDITTGNMYLHDKSMRRHVYSILAAAAPVTAMEKRSKAWQDVHFLQVAKEIADRHGLTLSTHGVENVLYQYILQKQQDDFSFLHQISALERCAFLMYDNQLVLYSVPHMEEQEAAERIGLGEGSQYRLFDYSRDRYGNCEITKGSYRGVYREENGSDRTLYPDVPFSAGSTTDAIRFAKNLLKSKNAEMMQGYFYTDTISPQYVPAAILNATFTEYPSWTGRLFITKVRNDYVAGKSKVFFYRIPEVT